MLDSIEKITPPATPPRKMSAITAPRFAILTLPIKNAPGSPLVVCAFSQKAKNAMKESQEAGSVGRSKKVRVAKDFAAAYEGARRRSKDGWDGVCASAFRNASISACRLVGFKMTIGKMSIFIENDGVDGHDGQPLVRIHGKPEPFEALVRLATGTSDIRVRPRFDEWHAVLRVRFDRDQFNDEDVVNLIVRAGTQVGIGEGRPDSRESFGQGWGLFEVDTSKPISLHEIVPPKIEFVRGDPIKEPGMSMSPQTKTAKKPRRSTVNEPRPGHASSPTLATRALNADPGKGKKRR